MMAASLASAGIFAFTYGGVALGRIPGLRLDRTGIALLGAALMVGFGVLTPAEAYQAIDFDTITLLLGMMIVVAHLRLSGFFRLVSGWAVTHARAPLVLLAVVTITTGLFSAFLVNDAVCLVMAPLVIEVTMRLRRDPVPYLLAVAMGSNVGSVATITGNPQNMIIGAISHIPYPDFAAALVPLAIVGLLVATALIAILWASEFRNSSHFVAETPSRIHKPQMIKAALVTGGVIVLFFTGVPVAKAAIVGAALLLLTRQVKPGKVYREIDGPLLLMFAGLFVVVAGAERTLLSPRIIEAVRGMHLDSTWVLTGVTALLSNLVSNVPAVLALKPFVQDLPDQYRTWLVIAMASTFAGNLSLIGSVANLIVAERARAVGIEVSFRAYLRIGVPLTLVTLAIGTWWLSGL